MKINFEVQIDQKYTVDEAIPDIKKALYLSMVKMKEIAIREAPIDMGLLRSSIFLHPNTRDSDTYTLEDGVPYGIYMEYGTRPHWAPIKPLIEWAKRHGGDEGFGYALRAKIAKVGVDAHPFFRPAMDEVQEVWMPYYFKNVGEKA
jgi:hypothetical protein